MFVRAMEDRLERTAPTWKFWHPLAFWKVFVVFLVAELATTFAVVALREGLGLAIPEWIGAGLGGGLAVIAVFALVRRAKLRAANA
jgi:hypothetical protein